MLTWARQVLSREGALKEVFISLCLAGAHVCSEGSEVPFGDVGEPTVF